MDGWLELNETSSPEMFYRGKSAKKIYPLLTEINLTTHASSIDPDQPAHMQSDLSLHFDATIMYRVLRFN